MKHFFIILLMCCFSGCSKDPGFQYSVPSELEPIIERFRVEAAQRGYKIKLNNLRIVYDERMLLPECGLSNVISSTDDVQKVIRLSKDANCWYCDAELEALIFHELGHCILGRQHDNGTLPKGYPRSLMVANDNQVYTNCGYPINGTVVDNYSRRSYYLDELFNPNTPVPDWGR